MGLLRGFSAFWVWVFSFMGLAAATQQLILSFGGASLLALIWFWAATAYDWRGFIVVGPLGAFAFSLVLVLAGYLVHGGGR